MTYTPELGQLVFGQPHKEFDVSNLVEAALSYLGYRLETVYWNVNQKDMDNPFQNSGGDFKNDTFHVQAYSWGDDVQPYNFKWQDVEISWYKYLGRGMSANMEITPQKTDEMLKSCLASIEAMDSEENE